MNSNQTRSNYDLTVGSVKIPNPGFRSDCVGWLDPMGSDRIRRRIHGPGHMHYDTLNQKFIAFQPILTAIHGRNEHIIDEILLHPDRIISILFENLTLNNCFRTININTKSPSIFKYY